MSSKSALFFSPERIVSTLSDNQKQFSFCVRRRVIECGNVRMEQMANPSLHVTNQSLRPVTIPFMPFIKQLFLATNIDRLPVGIPQSTLLLSPASCSPFSANCRLKVFTQSGLPRSITTN